MLRLHVRDEDPVDPPDLAGPDRLERAGVRAGVEEQSAAGIARADDVGVDDADPVRHAQRPDPKRQPARVRQGVFARRERAQPHLVQAERGCQASAFLGAQLGAVVDGVQDGRHGDPGLLGEPLGVQAGAAHRLVENIAELVLKRDLEGVRQRVLEA